ncbi:SPOR domain-containing protein [Roseateles sp.]|jgi:cell division protein FtsN|uniref:SPOR domain-containing protein n=1 Tax=Roseateles sp. TaxID=1971397 RepID=UPI0037CB7DD7
MSKGEGTQQRSGQRGGQRGGFVLGLIVGLLLGLGLALGVALYVTKVPIPFIDKVPQRSAEQDAAEAERNRNWDPNAGLAGKGSKAASGVVSGAPAPAPATPASAAAPAPAPAVTAAASAAQAPTGKAPAASAAKAEPKGDSKAATAPAAADPYVYFVQAGAYVKAEDAEAQRAKLAIQGFVAKVYEREQAGRTVHRVRMGPLDNREEAEALQRKLEGAGIEANLARVQR